MRKLLQVVAEFFRKSRELPQAGFKPSLELLERRDTPSDFFWYAGGAGRWEDPNNWGGTAGNPNDYPGWDGTAATTNDTARFSGANSAVRMEQAHELASIDLSAATATLTLEAALTLNNGGTMSNGTIIQRPAGGTTNGTITLTGSGEFTWTGGSINYSTTVATTPSTFTIDTSATLTVANTMGTVDFGSNLYIQEGVLRLSNTSNLALRNRPTITNEGGTIDVTSFGSLTYDGEKIPIDNEGVIQKSAGGTSYEIGMPVTNNVGSIIAQSGELRFSAAHPATGYSINQSGGLIKLQGGRLRADFGVYQDAGEIFAAVAGTSIIAGRVTVNGGNVTIGTATSPGATFQVTGDFLFQGGVIQYYYDTDAGVGGLFRAFAGSIWINPDTTALLVEFVGGGQLPASYRVMVATGGIDGQVGIVPPRYLSDLSIPNEYWLRLR